MVEPTSAAHRVLVEVTQTGDGLAGVADLGVGACQGINPLGGGRRHSGEMTGQVEHGALCHQQGAQRPRDGRDGVAGGDPGAVVVVGGELDIGSGAVGEEVQHGSADWNPGQAAVLTSSDVGSAGGPTEDRLGCDVSAAAQVLVQTGLDGSDDEVGIEPAFGDGADQIVRQCGHAMLLSWLRVMTVGRPPTRRRSVCSWKDGF